MIFPAKKSGETFSAKTWFKLGRNSRKLRKLNEMNSYFLQRIIQLNKKFPAKTWYFERKLIQIRVKYPVQKPDNISERRVWLTGNFLPKIWYFLRKMLQISIKFPAGRVPAKFPHSPIHHYTSIYGALLFSVSPVRCTCIIKYGAVRKFFQSSHSLYLFTG